MVSASCMLFFPWIISHTPFFWLVIVPRGKPHHANQLHNQKRHPSDVTTCALLRWGLLNRRKVAISPLPQQGLQGGEEWLSYVCPTILGPRGIACVSPTHWAHKTGT